MNFALWDNLNSATQSKCVSGGHALCDELPGFTLFLIEQTMYMKWEQVSFFMGETTNLHCSVVRGTLRSTASIQMLAVQASRLPIPVAKNLPICIGNLPSCLAGVKHAMLVDKSLL